MVFVKELFTFNHVGNGIESSDAETSLEELRFVSNSSSSSWLSTFTHAKQPGNSIRP